MSIRKEHDDKWYIGCDVCYRNRTVCDPEYSATFKTKSESERWAFKIYGYIRKGEKIVCPECQKLKDSLTPEEVMGWRKKRATAIELLANMAGRAETKQEAENIGMIADMIQPEAKPSKSIEEAVEELYLEVYGGKQVVIKGEVYYLHENVEKFSKKVQSILKGS